MQAGPSPRTDRLKVEVASQLHRIGAKWFPISDRGHGRGHDHGHDRDRCGDAGRDLGPGRRRDRDGVCTIRDAILGHGALYRDRGPNRRMRCRLDSSATPMDAKTASATRQALSFDFDGEQKYLRCSLTREAVGHRADCARPACRLRVLRRRPIQPSGESAVIPSGIGLYPGGGSTVNMIFR